MGLPVALTPFIQKQLLRDDALAVRITVVYPTRGSSTSPLQSRLCPPNTPSANSDNVFHVDSSRVIVSISAYARLNFFDDRKIPDISLSMAARPVLATQQLDAVKVRLATVNEQRQQRNSQSTRLLSEADADMQARVLSSLPVQMLANAVINGGNTPRDWLTAHVVDDAAPAIRPCLGRPLPRLGYSITLASREGKDVVLYRHDFEEAVELYKYARDVSLEVQAKYGRDFLDTSAGRTLVQSQWYCKVVPSARPNVGNDHSLRVLPRRSTKAAPHRCLAPSDPYPHAKEL